MHVGRWSGWAVPLRAELLLRPTLMALDLSSSGHGLAETQMFEELGQGLQSSPLVVLMGP